MKKILPYLIILILLIPAVRYLLMPGYFGMHDDLQTMRIFEMEKCFSDGQIPCRWVPDMAWGYGQPMFNFYSAFPYYLGAFLRMIVPLLSIMASVKFLFLVSLIGGALGMYLLAKELWGEKGAILAAILYSYAPYHALDIYIRGALSESFALMLLPFLWWGFYKLIQKSNYKWVLITSICLGLLLTTHNISSFIYAPFTLLWVSYLIFSQKKYSSIKDVFLTGIFGLGLSAFFTFPVLLEKSLVQTGFLTMDYLNYRGHFVALKQLFIDRSWGHGPSIWGPNDEISFQIGWPNWWLTIPLGVISFFWMKEKKQRFFGGMLFGLIAFFFFSAFMTHERSTPIWITIPGISIVQFPWRFLGPAMFFLALASGALSKAEYKFRKVVVGLVIILSITLNAGYFIPWNYYSKNKDSDKLTGIGWEIQQKSAILDYLPQTAPVAPKEKAFANPKVITGDGQITNFVKRTNNYSFDAEIFQDAEIQVPVMYFPVWKVIHGGKIIESYPSGDYGLITFKLSKGKYIIQGRFENTLPRILGNSVSIISLSFLFIGFVLKVNNKKFLWL